MVSTWLEPGPKPLQMVVHDSGRFPGISRWYVFGEPATLDAGADELSAGDAMVPVPVTPTGSPLWLGELLSGPAVSD